MQRSKRLKKPVTFRLSQEIDAKIRDRAEKTGLTLTKVVERAIEQGLSKSPKATTA